MHFHCSPRSYSQRICSRGICSRLVQRSRVWVVRDYLSTNATCSHVPQIQVRRSSHAAKLLQVRTASHAARAQKHALKNAERNPYEQALGTSDFTTHKTKQIEGYIPLQRKGKADSPKALFWREEGSSTSAWKGTTSNSRTAKGTALKGAAKGTALKGGISQKLSTEKLQANKSKSLFKAVPDFKQGRPITKITFPESTKQRFIEKALECLSNLPNGRKGSDLHTYERVFNMKIQQESFIPYHLILAYKTGRMWQEAYELVSLLINQNQYVNKASVNTAIRVLGREGKSELAMEILDLMKTKLKGVQGMAPDVITYNSVIDALAKDGGKYTVALELFEEMKRDGPLPNVWTYSSLIDAMAKSMIGRVKESQRSIKKREELQGSGVSSMTTKDGSKESQGSSMTTNAKEESENPPNLTKEESENPPNATRKESNGSKEEPETSANDSLTPPCRWETAYALFEVMKIAKVKPDLIVYNNLLDALAKGGCPAHKSLEIFKQVKEDRTLVPDVITYSNLIDGLAKGGGKWEAAVEVFQQMEREGLEPNVITYSNLIDVFAKDKGEWRKAMEFFREMKEEKYLKPSMITYTNLISAHACGGAEFWRSLDLFEEMTGRDVRVDEKIVYWDGGKGVEDCEGNADIDAENSGNADYNAKRVPACDRNAEAIADSTDLRFENSETTFGNTERIEDEKQQIFKQLNTSGQLVANHEQAPTGSKEDDINVTAEASDRVDETLNAVGVNQAPTVNSDCNGESDTIPADNADTITGGDNVADKIPTPDNAADRIATYNAYNADSIDENKDCKPRRRTWESDLSEDDLEETDFSEENDYESEEDDDWESEEDNDDLKGSNNHLQGNNIAREDNDITDDTVIPDTADILMREDRSLLSSNSRSNSNNNITPDLYVYTELLHAISKSPFPCSYSQLLVIYNDMHVQGQIDGWRPIDLTYYYLRKAASKAIGSKLDVMRYVEDERLDGQKVERRFLEAFGVR